MGNKEQLLRAMREANSAEERVDPAKKVRQPAKRLTEVTEIVEGPSQPRVAKPGNGKRFVPNRTKGRPNASQAHLTNEARKPWEAMKVSRRTWYRRLAKGATG